MGVAKEVEIVIVGGGICGLATALALHRKGITSMVLERSECLRATGAAISILSNGWRALDQLGIGSILRPTALPLRGNRDILLDGESGHETVTPISSGEFRCMKRSDLITSLADALPPGTIRFGCHVVSVKLDPHTCFPIVQLRDGTAIKPKLLIGCDGANSVVANFLELKPTDPFPLCIVRGFTNYPEGHNFHPDLVRLRRGHTFLLRIPMTNKLVYWGAGRQWSVTDLENSKFPELIRQSTLEWVSGFPDEMIDMIANSDIESLSLTQMRYRKPWHLLMEKFRKGMVVVAGDAMHPFCPFIAQGGSACLEDAVVLARCLAPRILQAEVVSKGWGRRTTDVEEALDQYVKERRMRIFQLSTQTYLNGLLLENSSSLVKFVATLLLGVLFRDAMAHTQFDCGQI